jgi:hypothetical protein
MSRTTLCILTATLLAAGSLAFMAVRGQALKEESSKTIAKGEVDSSSPDHTLLAHRSQRFFHEISLLTLPRAERQLVEFLLLLPVAALMICFFRNVIGLNTFGTFTPALVGLAFRDLRSWPGILIFIAIVLIGWLARRLLHRFHLLQVPRTSLMITFVVVSLVIFVMIAHRLHFQATHMISLFPLVILTGMIERFWTLEEEDGTRASFRTLANTLGIALAISLVVSRSALARHLLQYPETIGLIVAGQLLLGRYTGYRLVELYRFRSFLREPGHLRPGRKTLSRS